MSIDRREDAGEFYPGGKVISTRPVATGGDVKHAEFADVTVETNTIPNLRAAVRDLAAKLGATVVSAFAVCAAFGASVETAKLNELDFDDDPSVVTNVTFAGLATTGEVESIRVELGSLRVDVATNAAAIATLGDYANVSNKAVNALSRAEAEAGFTEWNIEDGAIPPGLQLSSQPYIWRDGTDTYWAVPLVGIGDVVIGDTTADTNATSLSWSGQKEGLEISFTATRTRLPTMADTTLTPIYSQTPTFSEWTIDPPSYGGDTLSVGIWKNPVSGKDYFCFYLGDTIVNSMVALVEHNPTTINGQIASGGVTATATRERTDIIGYTFGSQSDKPLQPKGDYATIDDIPDVSDFATREEVEPAITAYPRVYSFILGATNANFVVTNYQLTAEAQAARTHFDPSDTDLDFSTVPSSLRLEDASTGTNRVVVDSRDWTVWYFAQKIGKAIHTASTNAIETCRAWVNFTATGEENPIDDTLIIDVPNIWLMAGKTFEKHVASSNSCWVIRSKDVAVPISDNAQSAGGFLELTDAFGEPYMRFNKTDSYFVDPVADGIEYDSATGAWLVSYSTTTCPMGGANAVIEGSTTYPGKAILKAEDDPNCPATITWTGSANNWVMHAVPKPVGGVVPPKMFFGAVVEVEGQDYIEYLRPMSIPHLLVDDVKIAPEIPVSHPVGTTVPWRVVQ